MKFIILLMITVLLSQSGNATSVEDALNQYIGLDVNTYQGIESFSKMSLVTTAKHNVNFKESTMASVLSLGMVSYTRLVNDPATGILLEDVQIKDSTGRISEVGNVLIFPILGIELSQIRKIARYLKQTIEAGGTAQIPNERSNEMLARIDSFELGDQETNLNTFLGDESASSKPIRLARIQLTIQNKYSANTEVFRKTGFFPWSGVTEPVEEVSYSIEKLQFGFSGFSFRYNQQVKLPSIQSQYLTGRCEDFEFSI